MFDIVPVPLGSGFTLRAPGMTRGMQNPRHGVPTRYILRAKFQQRMSPSLFETPQHAPVTLDAILNQIQNAIAGVMTLNPEEAALRAGVSLLIVAAAALMMALIRLALRAIVTRVSPAEEAESVQKRPANARVGNLALGLTRIAIVLTAIYFLLRVWGLDLGLFTSGAVGAALGNVGRALLILVIAIAAVEISGFAIVRAFHRVARSATDSRRAAQVRTLAPVLRGAVQTVIVVLAGMMFLSQLGVEVAPLVAGAGIVGLAVGFGAQTIVKDFLTGIFLILEDIVSIGDIVMIQNFSGRIEDMTLRTIRLRDFDGTLHVFPYGEAQVIHNQTKTFSYFAFALQISYFTDIERAVEVTLATANSLREEPALAHSILQPVEIVGVDQLSDNGVVLKGRIKVLPGDQWRVGREFNRRIKPALDEAGVLLEHRHAPTQPYSAIDGPDSDA
jgi:small-conductance mechanosensitive channel